MSSVTAPPLEAGFLEERYRLDVEDFQMAELEKRMNTLGYIPFVSMTTSLFRGYVGFAQVIIATVRIASEIFRALRNDSPYFKERVYHHVSMIIHGELNLLRAGFEFLPFIGNILCAIYDSAYRFKYSGESKMYLTGSAQGNPELKRIPS
ncbi:hypothetical protein COB11_01375 [Candidatus Aerophobetes bacterium]|uniref:Uncharacterized protein n=1 Tax=Aerophobetes bacterium TaxID=2030807 RepID=A0A2A4YLN1_UNCAE|nr:MAG: hypothetical protein COB11_01375 [Candidatus Aerophobetes bacterium]